MVVIDAHIAGIPIEETLAMAAPVLGAATAAIIATLRSHRRRFFRRKCPRRRRLRPEIQAGPSTALMI
jgi:hypothetical protein